MSNLFKAAKEKGAKKAKNNDKEIVEVSDPQFHVNLSRLVEIQTEMDRLKAEGDILAGEVKEKGVELFVQMYEKTKRYPGSFLVKAVGVKKMPPASFMCIPTDKYIKIGEERYEELVDKYGDDIAIEKTVYTLDASLVEKYGELISAAIHGIKGIPKEDKEKLISATTAWEIKKGLVSEIPTLFPGCTVAEMVEETKPIFQVKNAKIEE